ncbi:amino acid deaminase [Nocardia acidivorans]|uniref:amino acid deaminase n=1 Tax=Nocardia acidivorans TaxID=404580 RepID=UPI00082B36FE|nr:amino acid deaminase [Nocardia acidivorans]
MEFGRSVVALDNDVVAALHDRKLGAEHKSLPPTAWGLTVREYLATAPHLDHLQTPVLTVDRAAVDSNLAVMAEWAAAQGVRLAPHGKTTMSPQLWGEQSAAGSWGITLATGWQAQVGRSFGLDRIMLANALVDPAGLAWAADELVRDPDFELYSWADGVGTVREMERHLAFAPAGVRLSVLVELGGPHGRTGARTLTEAHEIAEAIHASDRLILAGVGGYEGALAHDRTPEGLAAVRHYLDEMGVLHQELAAQGRYEGRAIITAGGSAYPDLVVERLAGLADEQGAHGVPTTVLLRSGAYVIHDDGFYSGISPLTAGGASLTGDARPLRSAMHGWARCVSRPEPGLALLDAGKRDLPFDEGLPVPQLVAGPAVKPLPEGATVTKLNDQHAFLRWTGGDAESVPVGAVVRLGLSHPCTAFDKWRLIPVIDDAGAERPRIVDFLHTFF